MTVRYRTPTDSQLSAQKPQDDCASAASTIVWSSAVSAENDIDAAKAALKAQSRRGPLTKDIVDQLVEEVGGTEARQSLVSAYQCLNRRTRRRLGSDAVRHLTGNLSGDSATVFNELYGNSNDKVFDANLNGTLDKDDRILHKRGRLKRINESKIAEVQVRTAVVSAARELNDAGPKFAPTLWDQRFNSDHFERVADNGVFSNKPGVSASAAVDSIFDKPKRNSFDCGTASKRVVLYRALQNLLGQRDFDRVFKNLTIGQTIASPELSIELRPTGGTSVEKVAPERFVHELLPGDIVYFGKDAPTASDRRSGTSGEWAIYLGEGMFYGHGESIGDLKTFQKWGKLRHRKFSLNSSVVDYRDGGSTPEAKRRNATYDARLAKWKVSLREEVKKPGSPGMTVVYRDLAHYEDSTDTELLGYLKLRIVRAAQQAVSTAQKSSVAQAATRHSIKQEVIEGWMTDGLPQSTNLTSTEVRNWLTKT